jgi:hypothetical protein
MSSLRRHFILVAPCVLLFLCLLPLSYRLLFRQMNPVSVLCWPEYTPLIRVLPDFYDRHYALWKISLAVAALLVLFLTFVMHFRGFTFRQMLLVPFCPMALAAVFEYVVIMQLDKHLEAFFSAGLIAPLTWLWDGSVLLDCFRILVIYTCVAAVPALIVCVVWPRVGKALTRRWS